MWFENTKTGITFEVDSVSTKIIFGEKELKYKGLINRLKRDADFKEVESLEIQAEKAKEAEKERKEIEKLRADAKKANK